MFCQNLAWCAQPNEYNSVTGDRSTPVGDTTGACPAGRTTETLVAQGGFDSNCKDCRRQDFYLKCKHSRKKREGKQTKKKKAVKDRKRTGKKYSSSNSIAFGNGSQMRSVFEPHLGLESLASAPFALEALAKFAKIDIPETLLREVEGVLILIVNLSQQTTEVGVITSVLSWVQGRVSKSLFTVVKDYVVSLLQSPQSDLIPDWLTCLRDMNQNWQLCKGNRAFKQISKLMGCLVMLGLCDISDVTFSVGTYQVFTPEINEKHVNALDIADALFETVVFFVEGAYLCFQTQSLKPLLVNDRAVMELDAEFALVTSWFDLVKNGNLQKFKAVSDQEFERRLNNLSTSLTNLSASLRGLDKKLVMDKLQRVLLMQNDFVALKVASGVRHAPWAIELFGDSSQGKTMLGDQLLDAILTSQDLPIDKGYRCAYNAGDKFMSNWTSDKLVLIFDDVSNEKSSFVERPPTRAIIDVINNQMFYAPKAEIDAKGKCFVEPWVVLATTNKKDMDAGLYSNCPYSIQRRMACITVSAKDQYQKFEGSTPIGVDTAKVREAHTDSEGTYTPPLFDDIWTLTVEQAVKPASLRSVATYAPIVHNGKELTNISMGECIQWAIEDFNEHRTNQAYILEGMRLRENVMKRCSHSNCIHIEGNCPVHDVRSLSRVENGLDEQFGIESVGALRKIWYKCTGKTQLIEKLYDKADTLLSEEIYKFSNHVLEKWDWIRIVPVEWLDHKWAFPIYKILYAESIKKEWNKAVTSLVSVTLILILTCFLCFPFVGACAAAYLIGLRSFVSFNRMLRDFEDVSFSALKERRLELKPIVSAEKQKYVDLACKASVGLAILYGLARAYRAYRRNQQEIHGSLEPKNQKDVNLRDGETNIWSSVVKKDLPISEQSKRMNTGQTTNVVEKSLVYGSIHVTEEIVARVNGLMVCSNVMLLPTHYFHKFGDTLNCTFRKRNPNASGGKFAAILDRECGCDIPGTDLTLCYITTGGSFKNILSMFPQEDMPSVPFKLIWRQKDGEILHAQGVTEPGVVSTYKDFKGGMYKNLTMDTFRGLCGAAIVSDTNGSAILGVHLGGTEGTPRGCYGSITQMQLFDAIEKLRAKEGVLLSASEGTFRTEVLDVQMLVDQPLHKKSPLNYLPENSQIEYLGSCIGRSVSKSAVKVTPISEQIVDVCGVPNIYCAPKFQPEWFGWQECLSNLAVPAIPYAHSLLSIAVADYKHELKALFSSSLWCGARPLTDHENLCGIPGKKFMDAIKLDTSVGYPLTGPKRNFVTELEPTTQKPNNRVLDDKLMAEIEYLEQCYDRGERGYPIAKACKKDEILAKPKCRIFYGNALSLTFLIRKYYLPLLRVLQMNPLQSECAVGINCHGPEWEQFYAHVMHYGEERIIGGDYGKYDQKIPAQLILASLRILIDFARLCNYDEKDLRIMEAMSGDIVYAYIAFNGDLIGLTEGTHISGNSLTVIINGICGALNMRCYLFEKNPDFIGKRTFRSLVHLMTYGDDNIGTVSPLVQNFTIKGFSEFLKEYGQIYTMPDKNSELVDFLPNSEFEFLKRKSTYHEKLGVHVGALVEKSIFKSLHCFLREKNSPLTEQHAAAQNIDTALREWFNHGPEIYEQRRIQMKEVARRSGVSHLVLDQDLTYDDRVAHWHDTYRG